MQKRKYFYDGIPLVEYCKKNNINISTIRSRIFKKKNNPKYSNYIEQQIVDMVVEAYGTGTKYFYKGMSLRKYCFLNDMSYSAIVERIEALKEENLELSNNEAVILSIENFENKNYRFFYKGEPLKSYCAKHPNLNYNSIRTYINREQEKNPHLSDNAAIEKYMNQEHQGKYKYYYLGIPLIDYCRQNNLSYDSITTNYIPKYKKEFPNLSDDALVERVMTDYDPFELKYQYNGISLYKYCKENDLSYYSVVSFVKRKKAQDNFLNIDDLVEEGINTINRYGIIYYYNGIPLVDYCKEYDLNIFSIRGAILRKKLKSNKPLQEIVNECVETYQKFERKYYYEEEPLTSFCTRMSLNYNNIIQTYLDKYVSLNIEPNIAIKEIVDDYLENPRVRTKYYFENQTLAKFCNQNSYSYASIWRRIKDLEINGDLNVDERIKASVKKYEERLEIKKIGEIFEYLKSTKLVAKNELKNICSILKIDYDNVCDLYDMGFNHNQAINMIWYFSDKIDNGYKIITDSKIMDLFALINKIEEENIDDCELYDLIGIYKSNLYDSRNQILLKQKKYIFKTIKTLCSNYDIELNKNNLEDFESEIKMYLIILIDKISLNEYGQMIKYMDLTVKGYFRKYLKEYQKEFKSISLEDSKYKQDKNHKNSKVLLDYIVDKKNETPSEFSLDMQKVLEELEPQDLTFIILKFQEDYSYEELALYFKMSIEEVKEKELAILSKLKNNEDIKVMKLLKI